MKNNKRKGFTLTELIIVIVIIGILAAVLIPSLSGYISKAKVSKGEQNARNMTSLLIGEILFNDEEFLMPNDVVEIVKKSGYDLVSELPEYSYWYDTETNTIKYVKLEEMMAEKVSADSSTSTGRSRVEALSETHPKWFYIDQTPNAIKNAIDGINTLVEYGILAVGENNKNQTKEDRLAILDKMDKKVEELANALKSLKKIDDETITRLYDFIMSFTTDDTIYYAESGYYNRQMTLNYNKTADIYVERAMFVNGEYSVAENGEYESVKVNLLSPLIIPGSVSLAADTIRTFVSGTVYLSANAGVDITAFNPLVSVSNIANIQNIQYYSTSLTPTYERVELRFRNGHTVKHWAESVKNLQFLITDNGILLQKNKTNNQIYVALLKREVTSGSGENVTYAYFPDTNDAGEYLTINGEGAYASLPEGFSINSSLETFELEVSSENKDEIIERWKNNFEENILSMYLIPTLEVNDNSIAGFSFNNLIDDSGTWVGKVELRSSIEPFSTQFTGIIVDKKLYGYKVNSFGYITDVVTNVEQSIQASVKKDSKGNDTEEVEFKINEGNGVVISVELPEAAKNFSNYKNLTVKVEYSYKYNEYVTVKLFGINDYLVVPTSYSVISSEIENCELSLSDVGIYTATMTDFTSKMVDGHNANQIFVRSVTITSGDNTLFVRYYK